MKKFFIPIILALCLSLTACGNASQQGDSLNGQSGDSSGNSFFDKLSDIFDNFSIGGKVDIFSEPEIVLDEDKVEIENMSLVTANVNSQVTTPQERVLVSV